MVINYRSICTSACIRLIIVLCNLKSRLRGPQLLHYYISVPQNQVACNLSYTLLLKILKQLSLTHSLCLHTLNDVLSHAYYVLAEL